MPQPTLNPAQLQPILKRIAHSSCAEVVFKSNCFEMHGLEQQVKAAVMMVLEQDIVHVSEVTYMKLCRMLTYFRISIERFGSRSSLLTNIATL